MITIKCVKVAENEYLGVTTLDDIRSNCMNPMEVAKSTEKQRTTNSALREAWLYRGELQRQFGKARIQRAVNYGHYIDDVTSKRRSGGYPPVTLWTDKEGVYDPATGTLSIKGTAVLTASDGETQLAARYMLAYGFCEDKFLRPIEGDPARWLEQPFGISITVQSSKEDAMQTLHDLNAYATPISEAETAPLNVEGVLTKAVNVGIEASNIDRNMIKNKGNVTAKSPQPTSMIALLHGALGVANGVDVLTKSSPATWLSEGNKPFADARGKDADIAAFVTNVLTLPSATLRDISLPHMLALGVYYARTGTIHPLPTTQVDAILERLKVENDGRRINIRRAAAALYDAIQRQAPLTAAA